MATEHEGTADVEDAAFSSQTSQEPGALAAARRHWRQLVFIGLLGSLVAYVGCHLLTPLYAAHTTVIIDPREPARTAQPVDPLAYLPPSEEAIRKNEIAMIRSRELAEAVVAKLHLDQYLEFNLALRKSSATTWLATALVRWSEMEGEIVEEFRNEMGLSHESVRRLSPDEQIRNQVVDRFLARLGTTSTDASRVIEIRFLSQDPERAVLVSNAVAEQFIAQKASEGLTNAEHATAAFETEIDSLNERIHDAERAIEDMRNQHGLLPASDLKIIELRMAELTRQRAVATADRATKEAQLKELEAAQASGHIDATTPVLDSLLIQRLQEQAAQVAARISGLSALYASSASGKMAVAQAELASLHNRINLEVSKIALSYHNDLLVARTREETIQLALDMSKIELTKASASEVDVRALEREAEAKKSLMAQLIARLTDTRAQINQAFPEARIISRATLPRFPTFPPVLPVTAAGLLLSLTLAMIVFTFRLQHDTTFRSTAQLRQVSRARVLGVVYTVKRPRWMHLLPASPALTEPSSAFAENLREIWYQVDRSRSPNAKRLLVASSVRGEGKTVFAVSLGRLLAFSGRKVVIVDADLRVPSVYRISGVKRSPGLAEVATGASTLDEALQTDSVSGASILTAGAAAASPSDILQSLATSRLLADLTARFDIVIIDSPPAIAVHDAGILGRYADITVMLVRWGATTEAAFAAAMQRIHDLDLHVDGLILTMADWKAYEHYGPLGGYALPRRTRKYLSAK